ncbi:hypothetical protein LSCM1_07750 [Leishmania martiniquensis]|uniref:Uncharacterized protein n=1 Tax=Leishmania martiniquensis TaxID=1580590 RepID=A0A836HMZ1_9TRYP|nr:hypothetical protein LSCM1_07750 [Leishmania martiniquensis]
MSVFSKQPRHHEKVAWLEAMLDTAVFAYESHRNALENIYDRVARWQRSSGEGCVHVSPAAVDELLKDIKDVLDQCALRLPPLEGVVAAAVSAAEQAPPGMVTAPPPSMAAHPMRRPQREHPQTDNWSSTSTLSARRNKAVPAPPPQVHQLASRSASDPSCANSLCEAGDQLQAASTATTESKQQLKSSSEQQHLPLSASCSRSSSEPPSTNGSAVAALRSTFTTGISAAADPSNSPAQLDKTAQEEQPQHIVTGVQLTMAVTVHESTPPQRARQGLETAESTPPMPQALANSLGPHAQSRSRIGVALTPWPIINDRHHASSVDGGSADRGRRVATTPSAHLREVKNHDELPAPQYRSYKETGRLLLPSPERRAAAAALEGRAAAEQNGQANSAHHQSVGARCRNREDDLTGGSGGRYRPSTVSSVMSASRRSMSARDSQRSQLPPWQEGKRGAESCVGQEQGIPRPHRSSVATERRSTHPRSHTASSRHQDSDGSRTPSQASNALRGHASGAAAEAVTLSSYASSSAPRRPCEPPSGDEAGSGLGKQCGGPVSTAGAPHMGASRTGSIGLVYTPTTTPQRESANGVPVATQQQQQQASTSRVSPDLSVPLRGPGERRRLRTSTPRRVDPKANDSSQVERTVYRRRTSTPPIARQPVWADVPETLQFMQREDALLERRRDRMLTEVHRGPCQLPDSAGFNADADTVLPITAGPVGPLEYCGNEGAAAARSMTAVEEQLVTESTILRTQLEKMEMELSIAVWRHRERGSEQRYAQLSARMARVRKDLDRVEWELYVVRNIDRKSHSQPCTKET